MPRSEDVVSQVARRHDDVVMDIRLVGLALGDSPSRRHGHGRRLSQRCEATSLKFVLVHHQSCLRT